MGKHSAPLTGTPTSVAHSWRATVRTVFQAVVGFAAMWALIVETLGLDSTLPWVAASLAVTGGITKVMNLPAVENWLVRFLPFLATGVHTETTGTLPLGDAPAGEEVTA